MDVKKAEEIAVKSLRLEISTINYNISRLIDKRSRLAERLAAFIDDRHENPFPAHRLGGGGGVMASVGGGRAALGGARFEDLP